MLANWTLLRSNSNKCRPYVLSNLTFMFNKTWIMSSYAKENKTFEELNTNQNELPNNQLTSVSNESINAYRDYYYRGNNLQFNHFHNSSNSWPRQGYFPQPHPYYVNNSGFPQESIVNTNIFPLHHSNFAHYGPIVGQQFLNMPAIYGAQPLYQTQRFISNIVHVNNKQVSNSSFNRTHKGTKKGPEAHRHKKMSIDLGGNLDVSKVRQWQQISKEDQRPGFHFKIMSYNVLSQDLLEMHRELYQSHDPAYLTWEERWANLYKEISTHQPDIFCLQEVQMSHIENYYSMFKSLGYKFIYKKRTGQRPDGCAIFYRTNNFVLKESTEIEFYKTGVTVLNRDNVAVVAKFALKLHPTREFVVATTHLLFNKKRDDVRLAQLQLLMASVDKISYKEIRKGNSNCYLPVIITGDFNSPPLSPIYNFMVESRFTYDEISRTGKTLIPPSLNVTDNCEHLDVVKKRENKKESQNLDNVSFSSGTLTHNFVLKSVYEHSINGKPEGTTFHKDWDTVDYIFYSGARNNHRFEETNLQLLSRYSLLSIDQLENVRIPNQFIGSDHFALVSKFKLIF